MESTTQIKRNDIIITLVLLANMLFLNKYLGRYIPGASLCITIYLVGVIGIYWWWRKYNWHIPAAVVFIVTAAVMIGTGIVLHYISVNKLKVDRWDIIYSFFNEWNKGHYPYGATTRMANTPGPLPIYFLLAYPFYLIKEIGYMTILALGLFVFYITRKATEKGTNNSFVVFLLLASPFIYWEIFARSTIFCFSVLWFIYADWLLNKNIDSHKKAIVGGILGGLLLSTRLVYALLLGIYGVYFLKKKVKLPYLITWAATTIITCAITILPFYLLFPAGFIKSNPIHTESVMFIPMWFNFFFLLAAIIAGWLGKTVTGTLFISGLMLFGIVVLYLFYWIYSYSWSEAFYGSLADISYFIIPIPFLLGAFEVNQGNSVSSTSPA